MERIDRMQGQLVGVAAKAQRARRASEAFAARGAGPGERTDSEVPAKAKRRQFPAECKRRILRETDLARGRQGYLRHGERHAGGDDLVVGVRASADALVLEDRFVRAWGWTIRQAAARGLVKTVASYGPDAIR